MSLFKLDNVLFTEEPKKTLNGTRLLKEVVATHSTEFEAVEVSEYSGVLIGGTINVVSVGCHALVIQADKPFKIRIGTADNNMEFKAQSEFQVSMSDLFRVEVTVDVNTTVEWTVASASTVGRPVTFGE